MSLTSGLAAVIVKGERPRRWMIVLFWIVSLSIYFSIRAIGLSKDPPQQIFYANLGPELMVEPSAKAHEARNWALFGAWQTNPVDNYQFWRSQSPAWVYPLALSLRTFGVSYETLRWTAVAFGLVGFVSIILLAYRKTGALGAVLASTMLGFDQFSVFYGRSGILEPIVAGWVALAVLFLDRAFDRVAWLVPALIALAVGLATKLAALPAIPLFLFYGVVAARRAPGKSRTRLIIALGALLLVVGFTLYAATPEYLRTLIWNFNHMVVGKDGGTDLEIDSNERGAITERDSFALRLFRFYRVYPFTLPIGAIALVWYTVRFVKRRDLRETIPAAWFLLFFVAVLIPPRFFGNRFTQLLGPPLLILTIGLFHDIRTWLAEKRGAWFGVSLPALLGASFVVYNSLALNFAYARQKDGMRDAARTITERIGDEDAVLIGLWSAPLVFPTKYKHYYVKSVFNSTKEKLVALGPTHTLLMREDATRRILSRQWPDALKRSKQLDVFTIRDMDVTFSELPRPQRRKNTKLLRF